MNHILRMLREYYQNFGAMREHGNILLRAKAFRITQPCEKHWKSMLHDPLMIDENTLCLVGACASVYHKAQTSVLY